MVFISYSSKDIEEVKVLASFVETTGQKCWYSDRDLDKSKGDAELQFLGSVIDLAGLRHELSFVLVIHDESYSETQFLANEESKKGAIHNIPIQDFDKNTPIWKKIHGPSAAMWNLFKQTQLYHTLMSKYQ